MSDGGEIVVARAMESWQGRAHASDNFHTNFSHSAQRAHVARKPCRARCAERLLWRRMTCVTYFSDSEVERHRRLLADKELRDILDRANAIPGENWFIESYTIRSRRLFRKPVIEQRYSLYSDVAGIEWQIINFAPVEGDWSINHTVRKCDILNYLTGYLGGWGQAKRRSA